MLYDKRLAEEVIINRAKQVRPGSFVRLGYCTELPVKAEFKKQGIRIRKITFKTVRLGVHYDNIKKVIERKKALENVTNSNTSRTNNYSWLIPQKISYNSNTDKKYIYAAYAPNSNTVCNYIVESDGNQSYYNQETFMQECRDYIINSYWGDTSTNKQKHTPDVFTISLENIFKIGDVVA